MSISFNEIPSTVRVPWTYIEFDNTGAVSGTANQLYKTLIFGQKLSGGSAVTKKLYRVTSADQAASLFGSGSLLSLMAEKYFKNNKFTETWMVALDDDAAGVANARTITVTGPATAAGSIPLLINGKKISVAVAKDALATAIATSIAAAINAASSCPFSATANAAVVSLTAKWKGDTANDIDIRHSYYSGEELPAGVTLAFATTTAGATNPDVTDVIDLIAAEHFNVFVNPYRDTENLTALREELANRWGPLVQKEGVAVMAKSDTLANLATFGNSLNTQFFVCAGIKGSPTASFEIAAALGAVIAYYAPIDQARPFQTLELKGVLPPVETDRFSLEENNSLLWDGISTLSIDAGGSVRIQRLITMYQTNAMGAEDVSYLDLNTILTLSYLRFDFRTMLLTKYPRHKLGDDGKLYGAGQAIMTPSLGKAEAIARFRMWEEKGLVENADAFAESLIVERNASDVNRLDFMLSPDLMNQLIVSGVQIKFIL